MKQPLYLKLAGHFERSIAGGTLRPGDRLPSIRTLHDQFRVSISTIVQALMWLEDRGHVEPRDRSGFYVRVRDADLPPEPSMTRAALTPRWAGVNAIVGEVVKAAADPKRVPLGTGAPPPSMFPIARMNRWLSRIARENPAHSARYFFPPGSPELRRQIARRGTDIGMAITADDIVITSGAMEALNLAIRAVVKPGDVVAVERPTYFGILQVLESLGMRVLEIPTHPQRGIDLDRLEHGIRAHRVKACIVMTNCHNPLGFVLEDQAKRELVDLTRRRGIGLIEDDIYGDLAFSERRPKPAKAFDRDGHVLLCSSFSKVLAPGLRVGWIQAGRHRQVVEQLQFINTIAAPSLSQLVVASMLESGSYQRHVRRLRDACATQVQTMSKAIARYFPPGTRVTRPGGGYFLWVQLPDGIDAEVVRTRALAADISVIPGHICSTSGKFRDHLRLSCASPFTDEIDRALLTLGRVVAGVQEKTSRRNRSTGGKDLLYG
jgi:DNA-binding transcriptional MocR family regulator